MTRVAFEVDIDAPVEQVFAFVADYRNALRYMTHFDSFRPLTAHSYGLGAAVRAAGKMHGFPISTELHIVEFEKNRRLASVSRKGIQSSSRWLFEPLGGRTRVTFLARYELTSLPFARQVLGRLLEDGIRAATRRTLENLKRELENRRNGNVESHQKWLPTGRADRDVGPYDLDGGGED